MEDILSASLRNLIVQSPLLLACLVGMILALVLRRRSGAAVTLVLVALALTFLVTIFQTIAFQYTIRQQMESGNPRSDAIYWSTIISILGSILRALSVVLLIIAAFIGRRPNAKNDL